MKETTKSYQEKVARTSDNLLTYSSTENMLGRTTVPRTQEKTRDMSHIKPSVLRHNRMLRTERKRRGWSQARLAKALGVVTRTVIRWEQGITQPHPGHRTQLESIFGKTAKELGLLWDGDENEMDDLMQAASSPLVRRAMLAIAGQTSLQVDTAVLPTMGETDNLLGRAGVFMQIKKYFLEANYLPFTALYGSPGVGKTTLAAALTTDAQVQAHFRDGILWAPLGFQPHVLSQLMRWGALLGVTYNDVKTPESLLAWGSALRAAIGTRRMLLIIDDVWMAEDAIALQVGGPQCTHLLITRQPQIAQAFARQHTIMVPQLEDADGLALLARYIPQFIQYDPYGARSLVQALGCLPLALTLLGKSLASLDVPRHSWPLRAALKQLNDIQDHLRLSMPMAFERQFSGLIETAPFSLYAAIVSSVRQLSPEALMTLCALAVFPPKPHCFSEEAALVMSQQPREMLDVLCNAGLLECWGAGRYSLHQTVAHCVRAKLQLQLRN